jgi:hypothetical protein
MEYRHGTRGHTGNAGYIWNLNLLVQAVVPVTLIASAWANLGRMELSRSEKTKTAGLISATIAAWFAVAWWLGHANVFVVEPTQIPRIQYALLIPISAGLVLMLGTQRGAALVRAAPQSWFVGMQVYRALAFVFLALWSLGQLPGEFAIPAGIGDVIVGASAPYVAWLNARRSASAERVTRAWNIFGIGDLIIAVTMGFLTSPSPLQMLAVDRPNLLITRYPLVMVPAFLVPASIILHGLSLWKLSRQPHLAGSAHHVPATNIA